MGDTDDRRLFEYFIVAGLADNAEELAPVVHECGNKAPEQVAPIVDVTVIFPSLGETVPKGYECIQTTPSGHPADLNHGSFRTNSAFLCYRRGYNKPPLVDLGILDESKNEKVKFDSTIIQHTHFGHSANVNNSSSGLYFTTRRSPENAPPHQLVITHICVILTSKGETPPHTYFKIDKNLNKLGTKYYGASLTFYERYTKPLSEDQMEKLELSSLIPEEEDGGLNSAQYYSSKAICIVSCYPFFEPIRKFLFFVNGLSESGPHKFPIERYISHLMMEVAFPSPTRPRVLVQLNHEMIVFESHDDSQVPLSGATFIESLKYLGVDNFVYVMLLALLEQKILVHSLRPWLLTAVSETLCAMMFPFQWQCPYIPQCPLEMAGVLHAPLPFIVGVHSRYFDLYEDPPEDVTCFDLDTGTVSNSNVRRSVKPSLLPKKPLKKLKSSLEVLLGTIRGREADRNDSENKKRRDLSIREEFLRFMCHLMAGYEDHLRPITSSPKEINATDTNSLFDIESFLKSRDKNSIEFYRKFCQTQCFIRFIEERSFYSDQNVYNVFFDDCILKVSRGRLLDYDSYLADHTAVVPPPEMFVHKDRQFEYSGFPVRFDEQLFETEAIKARKIATAAETPLPFVFTDPESQPFSTVRSKQETRIALTGLKDVIDQSEMFWPRSLLFSAYAVWFLHFPALVSVSRNKYKMLLLGFRVLSRMKRSGVPFFDQVCYRVLIWLCGKYGFPALAVDVQSKMRRDGVDPNAITYGTYHWAVMQGKWPSDKHLAGHQAWRRLRLRLEAASAFSCATKDAQIVQPRVQSRTELKPEDALSVRSCASRATDDESRLSASVPESHSNHSLCSSVRSADDATSEQIGFNDPVPMSDEVKSLTDPLGASNGALNRDASADSLNSSKLSPSREQFFKAHQGSPFSTEIDELDKRLNQERKRSFKLGTSWLKGITSSPIMTKIMKANQSTGDVSEKSRANSLGGHLKSDHSGAVTGSPSLHSLVNQFRKHAIRGYDGVMQQGSVMLKKSVLNSLMGEGRQPKKDVSGLSAALSSSEENLDLLDPLLPDCAYQLDSGTSGDLLAIDYWMKDAVPESVEGLDRLCGGNPEQALDVILTTASRCPSCSVVVYDEELMSAWQPEETNLNSSCASCHHNFVPSLKVIMRERPAEKFSSSWYLPFVLNFIGKDKTSEPEESSTELKDGCQLCVPYLSPLVLRKELETLATSDPACLRRPSLRVSHPIVFWNLLYYCRRLDLPSHMFAWIAPQVHIRCVFDLPTLHEEPALAPMYFSRETVPEFSLVPADVPRNNIKIRQLIVEALPIERGLVKILQYVIQHHREVRDSRVGLREHFSIYRDILFVALDSFGRNVDREQFDREFQAQLDRLPTRVLHLLRSIDQLPKPSTIACRRVFMPLDMN